IRDFHVTGVQTCALPICKYHFSSFTSAHPEFIFFFPTSESWRSSLDHKSCNSPRIPLFTSSHYNHCYISTFTMCNKVLSPIDNPMITIFNRGGTHSTGIRTCIVFGKAPSTDPLCTGQFRDPLGLLLIVSKG